MEEDPDDRWGIASYVLRRDNLDQRQQDIHRRKEEIEKESNVAKEQYDKAHYANQQQIESLKASILNIEVNLDYVGKGGICRLEIIGYRAVRLWAVGLWGYGTVGLWGCGL